MKVDFFSALLCFTVSLGLTIPALALPIVEADSVVPLTFGPTNSDTITFNVEFNLPVVNFNDAADLIITHSGTANTGVTITNVGLGETYIVEITGITGDGSFTLAVNTASDVATAGLIPLSSSVTSAAVTIDNTPPTVFDPTDTGLFTPTSTAAFSWTAPTDVLSGINSVFLELGSAPGLTNVASIDVTGLTNYDFTGLSHNDVVYAQLRVEDNAGNTTTSGSSDGIIADLVLPTVTTPTDAGLFTNSTTVTLNWAAPTDADSGINNSFLEIGSTSGASDLGTPVVTGLTTYDVLGLSDGDSVFARLNARDNAGGLASSAYSDGITVDLVAPTVTAPTDSGAFTNLTLVPFNWSAPTDANSGIASLVLQLGSAVGLNDLGNIDVTGLTTFAASVPAGVTAYAQLVATDNAGNVTTSASSDGIAVDTTGPTLPAVSDEGAFQISTNFRFFWNDLLITDAGSGVNTVSLRIGTFPGGADVGTFNVLGLNEFIFSGAANVNYYATLVATDNAGNMSMGASSDGIAADNTPPTGSAPVDLGFYSNTTDVQFNWSTPVDTLSGVATVILQVGLLPGGNTVFNGDVTGLTTTTIPAMDGQTLYARLLMIDAAGNSGFTASSNGILVDSEGPVVIPPTDTDDFVASNDVTFNWITPTDLVSGVFSTRLQIGTAPGLADVFNALVTGNSQTVPITEGQSLYARLISRDVAGNISTSASSDGITRDTISPTVVGPFDSGDFSTNSSILITWTTIEDLGSGLADVRLQVGSNPGAADLFDGTISGNSQIVTGVASGTTAYARIIATDNAGNVTISSSTDGITVDNIAPTATFTNISDPNFLLHTDFFFLLTASEPLNLLPQDLNLVGNAPGTIQVLPTANPNVYNVRVVLQQPIVASSFAVVLNAGATDLAGNPVVQPAVSDLIPLISATNSSEDNWMMHTY
ncbi:MAG: beta strand repeat-containing protein [Sumerlaeia bacterium]